MNFIAEVTAFDSQDEGVWGRQCRKRLGGYPVYVHILVQFRYFGWTKVCIWSIMWTHLLFRYSGFLLHLKIPFSIWNVWNHTLYIVADMHYIDDPWFHMENSFCMANRIFKCNWKLLPLLFYIDKLVPLSSGFFSASRTWSRSGYIECD